MRILLVSTSSGSRGGGEIFLLYLAEALRNAGHDPLLWCADHPRMDELAARFERIGAVYRDPYPNSYLDRKLRIFSAALDRPTVRRLSKRFASIPYDVIHLNKQTIEDGADLLGAVIHNARPVVSTIHITQSASSLGTFGGALRDILARQQLNRAGGVKWTAVSDARATELRQQIHGEVHAIYNAVSPAPKVDREEVRRELFGSRGWPADTLLVVCVARLVNQKDPSRFLRLAAKLFQKEPKSRFLWIGDGDGREAFHKEAEALGLTGSIDCTGWLDEPRRLLAGADLYLHPAAYEGLPLSILEAMAAGLPCVLSPEIAAEMTVFDENTVILTTGSGDEWLEQAATSLLRQRYAAASRDLYGSWFQPEAMADAFIRLYQSKY